MRLVGERSYSVRCIFGLLVALLLVSSAALAAKPKLDPAFKAKVLDNLMTAHQDELNAQLQYAAYAKKAEQEGYGPTAIQLWLMSYGEGAHARVLAKEIKRLGGKPQSSISIPEVKSTKENIEAAIKRESAEAKKTWPEFLHIAQEGFHDTTDYDAFDINKECPAGVEAHPVVGAFLMIKEVDASYAKNLADALKTLDNGKDITSCFLEPAGQKIRKNGMKLLRRYAFAAN